MSFNNLFLENIENCQYTLGKDQKDLIATQSTKMPDLSLIYPNSELGYEGSLNVLPSPETESNLSSPSFSSRDDDLDLSIPYVVPFPSEMNNIPSVSSQIYQNQMIDLLNASNQINSINYDSLLGMNNIMNNPLYSQGLMNNTFDISSIPLSYNTFDQYINTTSSTEIPPLIPSTMESNELIDSLLLNENPYVQINEMINPDVNIMNEIISTNSNTMCQLYENDIITNPTTLENVLNLQKFSPNLEGPFEPSNLNQMNTPPQSPVYYKEDMNKVLAVNNNVVNSNVVSSLGLLNNATTTTVKPIKKLNNVYVNDNLKLRNEKINSSMTQIKTEYKLPQTNSKKLTGMEVNKKINKIPSTPQPKIGNKSKNGSKLNKVNKASKVIQRPQIKHTFIIETPGENYGKKTSGRRRKNKKGDNSEDDDSKEMKQFPQVPSRPIVLALPPQKLSKIRARTSEDLESRPFQCEFCPSAFSRKHDLKRHVRIHLGIKPFKCESCGKCFSRLDALNRHNVVKGCNIKKEMNKPNQTILFK